MVHLIGNLVRDIIFCGPVYLRWMYLVERYINIFNRYMKNHQRPKSSIDESYIIEEAIEFSSKYLSEAGYRSSKVWS